jgi:hypothetical protein
MNVSDEDLDLTDTKALLQALGRRCDWVLFLHQTAKGDVQIYTERCNAIEAIDHFYDSIREAIEGEPDADDV